TAIKGAVAVTLPGIVATRRRVVVRVLGGRSLGQCGCSTKVVDDHLTYLEWAPDGFPVRLRSYRQANADVILDPRFGYGKPVFERTKVHTKDIMRQFLAGGRPEDIASDYDLTEDEVLAVIRVLSGHRDAA
ncbi:MAG: DUF433 domain-containing protein, partial [Pseudonocardiaceae bacterium]